MYEYIKGRVEDVFADRVILDVGGVGYKILSSPSVLARMPTQGDMVKLFVSFIVKEDGQRLFGFLTVGERELFETMLNVSGIGPKIALSLVGHLPNDELHTAISESDVSTLCRIPGIGKKTAERLILEVKDRLPQVFPREVELKTPEREKIQDAMAALVNLGYKQDVAKKAVLKAVDKLGDKLALPELITGSLKQL